MRKADTISAASESKALRATTRILIVDDHELMRDGLSQLISHEEDLEVCGEAVGEADARDQLQATQPEVAIVDISLKQGGGIELIKWIKVHRPATRTIVSSMHDESLYAERALRAGAMGYVNKQAPARSIIDAIRQVRDGKLYLSEKMTQRMMRRAVANGEGPESSPVDTFSDRELEVFELIGQGLTTGELADRLHLSPRTVATYRQRLKTKLNLKNAGELSREAVRWVMENR
jgi:DNA-binding NarL/FixJ family response regulator